MHYGDVEQLKENKLVIVIYAHSVFDIEKLKTKKGKKKLKETLKTSFEVTSIQECKYFPFRSLYEIVRKANKIFNKDPLTKDLAQEHYYRVTMRGTGYDTYEIVSVEDVTNSKNELDWLH